MKILFEVNLQILFKIIVVLAFLAGIVWLQIVLSKRRSKWPGLVLPIVYFLFVIYSVIILMLPILADAHEISFVSVFSIIGRFLIYNVPTAILLIIYAICRKKMRRANQLAKMEIQDLH